MQTTTSKASYVAFGIGIGVAVAILLAPQSGGETREFLKQKADAGLTGAKRTLRDMRDFGEHCKRAVLRQRDSVSRAVRAGLEAYH